jgi:hypothetical protein
MALAQAAQPAKPTTRYNIEVDLDNYPQATPKDALASVIKAIERKRVEYLLAHLTDPDFVDQRVKDLGGKFPELVREATVKLIDDPEALRKLRRIEKDGEWEMAEGKASAKVKDVREQAFLRKVGERWFLENRTEPEGGK